MSRPLFRPAGPAYRWLALLACCSPAAVASAEGQPREAVPVRVDERVKLLSIVFRAFLRAGACAAPASGAAVAVLMSAVSSFIARI